MAIGKIVKEALGTLAEEVTKEAPEQIKRAPRKTAKDLSVVPEEIRQLPPEERTAAAGEFLDAPKDLIPTRQEDIAKDTRATYAQKAKVDAQVTEQAGVLKKTELPEDADRMTMLQERQRNLFLKADKLSKEQDRVADMKKLSDDGASSYASIENMLNTTPGAGKTFNTLEGRENAIYTRLNTDMFELKEGLRTKWSGLWRDKELANETYRYLKDGKTKDPKRMAEAKLIGDQWKAVSDKTKGLRNRAGARQGKLEDWVVPQSHDAMKIKKAGYTYWANKIRDKLDKGRIENQQGRALDDVLMDAYTNITARQDKASGAVGGSVIAKRGEEGRVLHFKTGDGLIDYNNEFGNPDLLSVMDSHIRQQSNEIAQLQLFGSNPDEMYAKLKEIARANGDFGSRKEAILDKSWATATGKADGDDIVDKADALFANIMGTYRSLKSSASLGTAQISATADLGNMVLGGGYRNLNSVRMLGKGLGTLLQEVTTMGKVAKNIELANRIGVVSEFASASLANSRYAEIGSGWAQKAAEVVIRGSGLGSYTTSMRAAVGLEFAANLAENFSKNFDQVPFKRMMEEYGLGVNEWDKIRSTIPRDIKNAKFLDMNKVYELDEDLGYRLGEMITNEMDAFVVMPTNKTKLWTTWGEQKGTLTGEAARSMFMFKSFPIAVTMMHMKRMGKIDSGMGKVAYGSSVLATGAIMGGITLYAYDIVTGKTPRDIKGREKEFVVESLLKAGGLGIFGDLVMGADTSRYGHSYTATLVGVPAGTIEDIGKVMGILKDPTGDKAMYDAFNLAKNYIPGQNLWYTRAVIENTIGDAIRKQIDPNYTRSMNRRAKFMKQRGQEFLLK